MKNKFLIIGLFMALVLFFGCTDILKEVVNLPITNQTLETEEFTQAIGLSGGQELHISGEYSIITTDNVQIKELVYSAEYSKGVSKGSVLSFLGVLWNLDTLNCNTNTITMSNNDNSLTLVDGEIYYSLWNAGVTCTDGKLSSVTLTLNRKKMYTQGGAVYIPSSEVGYELLYKGKGVFELQ